MGVTGLWRLIEPAGKPVPVETLENKVLAVDISIWLHQMVKGYQDTKGAPLPNAHLMGLFQRLCKLLYFRIKPVFVFDGGFPDLKKETIAKRQDNKNKYHSESERLKRELALLLSKKTAITSLLGKQISPSKATSSAGANNDDDLFKLPALPQKEESESESEEESESSASSIDVHSVDLESDKFKTLSAKEKYDILMELKETRKQNSWGKLHELPKKSDNFSDYQMQRLLKRRKVQECLEETEKEMGDSGMSLNELESLLNEEGIDTKVESLPSRRIASNDTTRFVLINNVRQALADAKKKKEAAENKTVLKVEENNVTKVDEPPKKDELEDDLEKAIKMSLECVNEADTSVGTSKTDDSWTSCLTDNDYSHSDSEEDDGFAQPDMSSAKAYIMQYSDFTDRAIAEIVTTKNNSNKNKLNAPKVNKIIEELNNEKSVIVDNVDISSSDSEDIHIISNEADTSNLEKSVSSSTHQESSDDGLSNVTKEKETMDHLPNDNSIDATQASIICIENPPPPIISLDTSSEEIEKDNMNTQERDLLLEKEIKKESSSSEDDDDDDFEEVEDEPKKDSKSNKPVVQLTLNMDGVPDDDIFADIFTNQNHIKSEDTKTNVDIGTTVNSERNNALESKSKAGLEYIKPDILDKDINKSILSEKPVLEQNKSEANFRETTSEINKTPGNIKQIAKDDSHSEEPGTSVKISEPKEAQDDVVIETVRKEINNAPKEVISEEKLNSMIEDMQNKEEDLIQEKGRLDRVGRNITEQMTKEAQELLQIFGIPYIVAPMEAEAQCAFLESVNLTEGTITDDSDIWLFGGRTVYKNFFNQKKHVLQFLSERIERSFNLTREQLILLALLVGSDYTTGITGVGPVTALEILASFPFSKRQLLNESSKQNRYLQIVAGLQEFKQWVRAGKRTDNITLKKKLKNVKVTDDFPSVRVVQAYLEPNIEKSEEKFTWGEMDITILRDYAKAKFGWSQNKLDEIVKPVLKRLAERKTQKSVQDYFKRKIEFQSLEDQMSKRVKAAVQRMDPEKPLQDPSADSSENTKMPRKRKINKKDSEVNNQTTDGATAGPSKGKKKKNDETSILMSQGVKVVSQIKEGKSTIEISIPKSDRCQEIIPQREKDKRSLLENKLKAIELFRKNNIDRKKKLVKRKALVPKDKAELSESDSD